jgi:phosphate starvation-inducible protein PhoH
LTAKDVVRHALVQKIINAYDKFEKSAPNPPARQDRRRRR